MAVQDYDLPTEPLYRRHRNSFDDARSTNQEIDKGTLWAGAFLGCAFLLFVAYMLVASPTV